MGVSMRLGTLFAATFMLGVLACGPARAADDEIPKDQAQLQLHAAMSGISASSFFHAYASEACEDTEAARRLATFNFVSKKEQTELVPAGKKLYVLGVLHVTPKQSGETVLKNACRAMRSFTPEGGRVYAISQDPADRNCPITIKDAATGAEVASEKHKPKGACKEKK
jgi:hypothetical protein